MRRRGLVKNFYYIYIWSFVFMLAALMDAGSKPATSTKKKRTIRSFFYFNNLAKPIGSSINKFSSPSILSLSIEPSSLITYCPGIYLSIIFCSLLIDFPISDVTDHTSSPSIICFVGTLSLIFLLFLANQFNWFFTISRVV